MGYRVLNGIDEKLLLAIIHIGATEGVTKATIKRVAAACGVTHTVLLNRFGSTRGSLDAAAKYVDTRGMAKMEELLSHQPDHHVVWDEMLDYFLARPEETLYYNSYIGTFGFDPSVHNPRAEDYRGYAILFFGEEKHFSDARYLLMWDYITTMLFYYAEKIIRGQLPDDPACRTLIRRLVFTGIDNIG